MANLSQETVKYLHHHLFLPSNLPGTYDGSGNKDAAMNDFVLKSLEHFLKTAGNKHKEAVIAAISVVESVQTCQNANGTLHEPGVSKVLHQLVNPGARAAFHITAQNAGILASNSDNFVCFEFFELSPVNSQVHDTRGRLIRHFPASAIRISLETFSQSEFQAVMAKTMAKMSHQVVPGTKEKVRKAEQDHDEERDTTHPRIVTELLMSILRGMGEMTDVEGIRKNTREEVMWNTDRRPWRRSPLWLLIRVSLQLTMARIGGESNTYKCFMVFLLARVLEAAKRQNESSDALFTMSAKICRRLKKLGHEEQGDWLATVESIVSQASECIANRWRGIQNRCERGFDLEALKKLNMPNDASVTLEDMQTFISSVSNRREEKTLGFCPTAGLDLLPPENLPKVVDIKDSYYSRHHLALVEAWVAQHLESWIQAHMAEEFTPQAIYNRMKDYHKEAAEKYNGRPENMSKMFLVVLELWVALDRAAIHAIPLLRDYDPEVPIQVFQALLLASKSEMERLVGAEVYIRGRYEYANKVRRPSALYSYGEMESFQVRYFSQSTLHQNLKKRIENDATREREAKRREFEGLQKEYQELMAQYRQRTCDQVENENDGIVYFTHSSSCARCTFQKRASDLTIWVHEWPLSDKYIEAQATVFELSAPAAFLAWRDATVFFLDNVLECKNSTNSKPDTPYPLRDYNALLPYRSSEIKRRIHLVSNTKPHVATHRNKRIVGESSVADVLVNNGLSFNFLDANRDEFLGSMDLTFSVSEKCTLRLPARSRSLQCFITRTHEKPEGEAPNQVLAMQYTCPEHMVLGEFKALVTLPLGYRIQWLNVLTQLAMPEIDFNKLETAIFLLQISHQAGPANLDAHERCSHARLCDLKFGTKMHEYLHDSVLRIKENWESHTALATFIFLTTRLLSMALSSLEESFLQLLCKMRDISYRWLLKVRQRAHELTSDEHRLEFQHIKLSISLLCAATFSVDDGHLEPILSEPEQAAILIEVSIDIYNNANLLDEDTHSLQQIMHDRWIQTLHRARPMFSTSLDTSLRDAALNIAVKKCWPAFTAQSPWTLANSTCHWFETESSQLQVHLDILKGKLLVDGRPLSRLPHEYEAHAEYKRLFGRSVLDVMPSPLPGLDFCSTKSFKNNTAHFGLQEVHGEYDILVCIVKDESILELVPPRVFKGLLPNCFVENYLHWYHCSEDVIEFRPLNDPWTYSDGNWFLSRHDSSWKLARSNNKILMNPKSNTAVLITEFFSRLEAPLDLYMAFNSETKLLSIELPRLRLTFFLEQGSSVIQSKQFQSMQLDAEQRVGTLVGFESKLVLRDMRDAQIRRIVIPHGEISFEKTHHGSFGAHVTARVNYGTSYRVNAYTIDSLLCRLKDDGTMDSRLHLCYAHALTSFSIPDPFTGRTGTEQALSILNSAFVRSAFSLSDTALNTLKCIAQITPKRSYYPSELRVMQKVKWNASLGPLAQDSRFFVRVQKILDRVFQLQSLYGTGPSDEIDLNQAHMDLVKREINKASVICVSGFGAEKFTHRHDHVYKPRDSATRSTQTKDISEIVHRINIGQKSLLYGVSSNLAGHLYTLLKTTPVLGKNAPMPMTMEYDSAWLDSPETFLSSLWCPYHQAVKQNRLFPDKFQAMVWLAALSYAEHRDEQVIQTLLCLYLSSSVSSPILPDYPRFELAEGDGIRKDQVLELVSRSTKPLRQCPEVNMKALDGEEPQEHMNRRNAEYSSSRKRAAESFWSQIAPEWPCATPRQPSSDLCKTYINMQDAMRTVKAKWDIWYANLQFTNYLESLAKNLRQLSVVPIPVRINRQVRPPTKLNPIQGFISISDTFSNTPGIIHDEIPRELDRYLRQEPSSGSKNNKLEQVLKHMDLKAKFGYERRYLEELRKSHTDLLEHGAKQSITDKDSLNESLQKHLKNCEDHVQVIYKSLSEAVRLTPKPSSSQETGTCHTITSIMVKAEFYPRICPVFFLQQLRNSAWKLLSPKWKKAIVRYATAITFLQQARRLVQVQDDEFYVLQELQNTGRQGWNPYDHPEWLLLECESELMVRKGQIEVARQMIKPPKGRNSVMQLNMGEGKSSVIIPLVSLALSDGSQLVRVIVGKPQAKQMYQILMSKLAGWINRPVYRMPFSRAIQLDLDKANKILQLAEKCMKKGGVMMVQPEHLLSFQLMGVETQIGGQSALAKSLLDTQSFFDKSARDIVDESDENFSVKFELIYTIGQQQPIDYSPERWTIVQEVLNLIAEISSSLKSEFPQSVDLDNRRVGRYPRIRVLRTDAQEAMVSRVANIILENGIAGLPLAGQPLQMKEKIRVYITKLTPSREEIMAVQESPFWSETTIKPILLLRGLFAGGILAFALGQKRWRVNYGIDENRDKKIKLAVPFRAKDSPTPRSEFSHPDVVIILTCLSYYYSGLGNSHLFVIFEQLLRSEDSTIEYGIWVKYCKKLPEPYKQLKGINLCDRIQCESEIFPHLRYSKGAIDYFLSKMVFAKESREFPFKLTASGWDLGKKKTRPVTGFSGTNDSRYVLPLDVTQLDLPRQRHTNALVLEYLLQPENSIATAPQAAKTSSFDSETLLDMMAAMSPKPRVVLDVGAQIIDVCNLEFSREWLGLAQYRDDDQIQAVIFFNDADELVVLDKAGNIEELQASPFATQLGQCLVLLDEAHTRGTDLKLPADYRAAVTLGANLTKDRLVQACMRMRRLGKGQSVVFCIPWEVSHNIHLHQGRASALQDSITIADVLCWVIKDTCDDLQRTVPLWLTQGCRFHSQNPIWEDRPRSDGANDESKTQWAKKFLEPEAQVLEQQYMPEKASTSLASMLESVNSSVRELFEKPCADFGLIKVCRTTMMHEEQERELSPEVERVQQIERPPPVKAEKHDIDRDVRHFISNGLFPKTPMGLIPAFEALRNTSAAAHLDVAGFPKHLWVTRDFSRTVEMGTEQGFSDSFQRSMQWLVTSNCMTEADARVLVISPFEAQGLISDIQESKVVTLHIYAPQISLELKPLDHLALYTVPERDTSPSIPRQVTIQLNLFAGQLYIASFKEYTHVCEALGLASTRPGEDVTLGPDGFIPPGLGTGSLINNSGLTKSPVKFFKVLMTRIRRNCETIERTHMGKRLDGVFLRPRDFESLDD
ncbi:hypothetical protein CDD82_2843 [Ophiocordyceps australis]|uniref:ubiquitinyl hydrolase 1 n=1 Tax=Ophiocordyceps australis TaxID=1399860 RepID=A0A2C5ZTP1_9HYPO|nr:hypothetical protein CDD82_2843 [Ophiocordyceps australis]